MCLWNKILIGLIFVTSGLFFYLAARSLKTHHVWQEAAVKIERKLAQVEEEIRLLEQGDPAAGVPSIGELQLELDTLILDRGRAWYNAVPQQVRDVQNPATQDATVVVMVNPNPRGPHRIAPQTNLYVFEGKPFLQGGRYLGQFIVTNVVQNGPVQMQPAVKLTAREAARLKASRGPWVLYERMPKDSHDGFAGLDQAELQRLIPPATVAEYLNDGKKMTAEKLQELGLAGNVYKLDESGELAVEEDPEGNLGYVALGLGEGEGQYVRPLRDYAVLFTESHRRWTLLTDRLASVRNDTKYLSGAQANALAQEQANEKDIQSGKTELQSVTQERDAVAGVLAQVQQALEGYRARNAQLIATIRSLASELARLQMEAIRRVDARTREMARAGLP